MVRKSVQSSDLKLNLNTKDLEPGTYFLHVTIGENTQKQQLIIN